MKKSSNFRHAIPTVLTGLALTVQGSLNLGCDITDFWDNVRRGRIEMYKNQNTSKYARIKKTIFGHVLDAWENNISTLRSLPTEEARRQLLTDIAWNVSHNVIDSISQANNWPQDLGRCGFDNGWNYVMNGQLPSHMRDTISTLLGQDYTMGTTFAGQLQRWWDTGASTRGLDVELMIYSGSAVSSRLDSIVPFSTRNSLSPAEKDSLTYAVNVRTMWESVQFHYNNHARLDRLDNLLREFSIAKPDSHDGGGSSPIVQADVIGAWYGFLVCWPVAWDPFPLYFACIASHSAAASIAYWLGGGGGHSQINSPHGMYFPGIKTPENTPLPKWDNSGMFGYLNGWQGQKPINADPAEKIPAVYMSPEIMPQTSKLLGLASGTPDNYRQQGKRWERPTNQPLWRNSEEKKIYHIRKIPGRS
mgnify:FL=1